MAKRAAGEGTIRKRSDGRWEAIIVVGTNPGTGKAIRRSVYGKTQKEVKDKKQSILEQVKNEDYKRPDKTSVGQWLDIWLTTFCRIKVKQSTLDSYEAIIRNHIKPAVGSIRLQDLCGVQVQKLYNDLLDAGKSPKTVRNVAAVFHKAVSVAVKQKIIGRNPCGDVELPTVNRKQIKPLEDREIPLFISAIEGHPFRNAYALCLFAGVREGEALGLSWNNVDFEKGQITISQQLQKRKKKGEGYRIVDSTKSGKYRTIEPPAITFKYLRAERARQAENQLAAGELWSNPDNLVFTDKTGKHLAIPSFYKAFKRIAAAIGRPDARPHDLRHTAATVAIASGADIKSVQDLMGHATAAFTLNVYAHTSDQMKKDTAARMQSYYDNLTAKKA